MFDILFAVSLHFSDANYNWLHPHIRYQTESGIIAGAYYNSIRNPSVYIGRHHAIGKWWIEYGAVTGYEYRFIPMLRGGYTYKRANLFISPLYDKYGLGALAGIEIKLF